MDLTDTSAVPRSSNAATDPAGSTGRLATRLAGTTLEDVVGAENLRHQAVLVNHAPGAVTPLNPEMARAGDAVGQRA